jgi:hypothetical protein
MTKRDFNWAGLAAFALALGVALGIVLGFINAVLQSEPMSAEASNLLSTLGGAAIGAVATYIGIAHTNGKGDTNMEDPGIIETPPEPEPEPAPEPEPEPDAEPDEEEADDMTQGMGPGEEVG